jgi:hypothetical protein
MTRPTEMQMSVQCITRTCPDYQVGRTILLPHLGDGVFLRPYGVRAIGLESLNLICGTCGGRMFVEGQ